MSGPITIRLELDKTQYALGEIVKIKTYLVNNENTTVKIYALTQKYFVFNLNGECVYSVMILHDFSSEHLQVLQSQGETQVLPFKWEQTYATQNPSDAFRHVDPGTYIIKATISGSGYISETSTESFGPINAETSIKING